MTGFWKPPVCMYSYIHILIISRLISYHWTKSGISSCRTQVGHVHDISCPLHISSQHDMSHFLPHVIWRIEPNPLHITDAGQMIFPFCPQHDTWNFMLQDLCSTGAWHVGIPPTPPSPLPLYFPFTCTHILYIKWYNTHKHKCIQCWKNGHFILII